MKLGQQEERNETEGQWYAPVFLGNRDLPPEEQVEMELFPFSKKEKDAFENTIATKSRSGTDILRTAEMRQRVKTKRAIEERVGRIRRLFIATKEGDKPVENGKQLWAACENLDPARAEEIIDETIAAITDASVLEEGLLGKSISRSGSV